MDEGVEQTDSDSDMEHEGSQITNPVLASHEHVSGSNNGMDTLQDSPEAHLNDEQSTRANLSDNVTSGGDVQTSGGNSSLGDGRSIQDNLRGPTEESVGRTHHDNVHLSATRGRTPPGASNPSNTQRIAVDVHGTGRHEPQPSASNNEQPTRSQPRNDVGASTSRTPNYGSMYSQNESGIPISIWPPAEETEQTPGNGQYGYMPGMNVEITRNEASVPTQHLSEGLRHVMLHVVGSRPLEDVKFRKLKLKLDQEGQPLLPDNPFMPRSKRRQKPPAKLIRQQSRYQSSLDRSSVTSSGFPHTHDTDHSEQLASLADDHPSDDDAFEETVKRTGLSASSGRQKSILIILAMNDLFASMSLSVLAPFFPKVAREKGVSESLSGWVFGVFALAQCLTSPVFGYLLPRVGPKFLSQAGQFFSGGCTILFGLLQFVSTDDGGTLFIVYCFVLRIFMAVGCAANCTAAFAIAARTFPDNPATVFGLLETAVGFGLMLGPAIGGVLYEVGGFVAPFAAIGSVMVLSVPIGIYVLPSTTAEHGTESDNVASIRDFLSIPAVTITALAAFVACGTWVMPDPTLEPHLSRFNLSPTIIGLVFLLMSACYAVCAPVCGWVADSVENSAPIMVVGFAGTGLGFLLLGPSPIIPVPDDFAPLWLDIVALIIIGLFVSLAIVPTYDKILDAAEKAGIPDTLANCSTVSGLWNASYSFGEFVGPVLSGYMSQKVGFPWTMSAAALICFLMSLVMLILYICERIFGVSTLQPSPTHEDTDNTNERTPLLA